MSGLSGQAEITITKPDGRQIKQVIKNNIVDDVYDELRGQIVSSGDDYASEGLIPTRIKITLSSGGVYLAPSSNVSEGGISLGTNVYAEYSIQTAPTGAAFTGIIDGYVSRVDLMAENGSTIVATADTANNTFTPTSTGIATDDVIDDNDTVSCTYRIQFQGYADSSQEYVHRLLRTIQGATQNITMSIYRLTDDDGGQLKTGELSVAGLATADGTNAYTVLGTVITTVVPDTPVNLEILTSDSVRIMNKALLTGLGNDTDLATFDDGDTVIVPFEFTLTQLITAVT